MRYWLILIVAVIGLVGCGPNVTEAPEVVDEVVVDEGGETAVSQPSTIASTETIQTNPGAGDIVTENTYISLYEQVNPSVVEIRVVSQGSAIEIIPDDVPEDHPDLPPDFEFPELDPFDSFPQSGQGSGFVYDSDGHIVTNNHVVAGADRVVVIFADDTEIDAVVVGTDPDTDLAVIKIDADELNAAPLGLGDSDSLRVGQIVAAIGNPFGLDGSMSTGIISGLGRLLPSGSRTSTGSRFSIPDIIQTDTAINPGNSGGPLLNLDGEVIGVNTAIEAIAGGFGGVGYVIPSNTVQQVVPQLIENGRIQYPWLGISGVTLSNDLAIAMDLDPEQDGVLVMEVVADSPSEKAELRGSEETVEIDGFTAFVGGDVIVQIDDIGVHEFDDLLGYIVAETAVGDTVTLQILRDGELETVEVTMEARP